MATTEEEVKEYLNQYTSPVTSTGEISTVNAAPPMSFSDHPPKSPEAEEAKAAAEDYSSALESAATVAAQYGVSQLPGVGGVASAAIGKQNLDSLGSSVTNASGLGSGEKSDLAMRAEAEAASMGPNMSTVDNPDGEWVGADGSGKPAAKPKERLHQTEYGVIPVGFDPVARTPDGLLVAADGRTFDTSKTAHLVRSPTIPEYNRSYGGKMVPARELQVGRSLGIEHGVPIPEEAMEAYMQSLSDREVAAEAASEAAADEAYIRRKAEIATAKADAEGLAAQQDLSELHQREYKNYRDQYESMEIDPNRAWNQRSGLRKVLAIIGVMLGGMAAPHMGGRNTALEIINREIERDIHAQEQNRGAAKHVLDNLGEQFGRDTADLDLERAKRLKGVEMQVARMIQGANVDQNRMEAMRRDLLAPIAQAYGDLIDRAAQRAAGKKMEEIKYQTQQAHYVGGGGGGLTTRSAIEVYKRSLEEALNEGKMKEKEAREYARQRVRDLGGSKRTAAIAEVYTHTGGVFRDQNATSGTDIAAYGKEEQKERKDNFIILGANGEGIYHPGLTPKQKQDFQNRMVGFDDINGAMAELLRIQSNNATGTVLATRDRQRARAYANYAIMKLNSALRDEVLARGEMPMFEALVGNPDLLVNVGGRDRLLATRDIIQTAKENLERRTGGARGRITYQRGADGGLVPLIEIEGKTTSGPRVALPPAAGEK